MKCPHCTVEIHEDWDEAQIHNDDGYNHLQDRHGSWYILWQTCPACDNAIVKLQANGDKGKTTFEMVAYPRGSTRPPLPPEVPKACAKDYKEACLVLDASPQASAALSRRCLQHVLREAANTKKKDLAEQIDEVLPSLPSSLAELIDSVRVIGNFAAHPMKGTNTGEILEVEPMEAELLLEVLEAVFDHYFVQPARSRKRRDAINAKLQSAGKPPMKQPKS